MKKFFEKYSYASVRMFVNQCAIALFGNVLALFTIAIESNAVTLIISALAILFYLFLTYTVIWDVGSRDKPAIDGGRMKLNPLSGTLISLAANLPNFVLALVYTLCFPFAKTDEFWSGVCAISKIVAMFIQGMYTGILSVVRIGDVELNKFAFVYFLLPIPAMIVSTVGYVLGAKDKHLTKILIPMTPEELEVKREKKAARKGSKD